MENWTPEDLQVWRARMRYTQAMAAELLGLSLRAYSDRENGKTSIPRECVLACQMIERQQAETDAELGGGTADLVRRQIASLDATRLAMQILFKSALIAISQMPGGSKVLPAMFDAAFREINQMTAQQLPPHAHEQVNGMIAALRQDMLGPQGQRERYNWI